MKFQGLHRLHTYFLTPPPKNEKRYMCSLSFSFYSVSLAKDITCLRIKGGHEGDHVEKPKTTLYPSLGSRTSNHFRFTVGGAS